MPDFSQYPNLLENFPRGTTVPMRFRMVDPDGNVIDVTSGIVVLAFSTSYPGTATPTLEVEISPVSGSETLGLFAGEISASDSLTLSAGSIYYDMKFIDLNDKPYTFDMNKIKILNEVSDRIVQ
jgi:hypothetical protein